MLSKICGISFVAATLQLLLFPAAQAQAYDPADVLRASKELGLVLPNSILEKPAIAEQLDILSREKCDRQAIYQLSQALEDAGRRREGAQRLVGFSENCKV